MAESNQFSSTVESLFKGMEGFVTTKTVVGDPIELNGAVILPLVDVSFGAGAGATAKNGTGGGLTGKITPSAILIIQNNSTRLLHVNNQDTVTKIIDMVPDLVNRFTQKDEPDQVSDEEAEEAVKKAKAKK